MRWWMPTITSRASFERAVGGERHVELGPLRLLDVDDHEALAAGRDVGVGARHVDALRVGQRDRAPGTMRGAAGW